MELLQIAEFDVLSYGIQNGIAFVVMGLVLYFGYRHFTKEAEKKDLVIKEDREYIRKMDIANIKANTEIVAMVKGLTEFMETGNGEIIQAIKTQTEEFKKIMEISDLKRSNELTNILSQKIESIHGAVKHATAAGTEKLIKLLEKRKGNEETD